MSGDVSVNLITTINDNLSDSDWQAWAMVVDLEDRRVSSITGYVYTPDGEAEPAIITVMPITGAVIAYLNEKYAPDEPWPVQLLVQFDQASGGYEVTMEDANPQRWNVNADDLFTLREQVRPDFDD